MGCTRGIIIDETADSFTLLEPREEDFEDEHNNRTAAPAPTSRNLCGYKHKCAGYATGVCKSRKVPFSERHDVSDDKHCLDSFEYRIVTDLSLIHI